MPVQTPAVTPANGESTAQDQSSTELTGVDLTGVELAGATVPGVDRTGTEEMAAAARLMSLSPSRAGDFMTCPLLYRFRVIDRLPERPSPAATRGTVVHAVLERLFDLPAGERTLERAAALIEPQWNRLLTEEPGLAELFPDDADGSELTAWLKGAHGLLERYFALEDPNRLEPAERELFVQVELESGLTLRGYVDRLDVAPGGDMRVVDYKTGRAPLPEFEAKAMFQMRFYALVLWKIHRRVPRVLQLLYLGSGEVLRYAPDESDLRSTERKVRALWAAIQRATATQDWRPRPSKLCDWCDHQALCPAFGGTPPPLPQPPGARPGPESTAPQGVGLFDPARGGAMSIIPTPPDVFGSDDETVMPEGDRQASGNLEQATRPFEQAPSVEDEQLRGNAPLDPDKGAP